jgi:long-chain acyl-CoA synthetase
MSAVHITARESAGDQRRAAAGLLEHGVRSGDRVAIVARSSSEYLAVVLGALRVGIVPVLLNPALTDRELAALLDDAEPVATLRDADLTRLVATRHEVDLADAPLARPMLYTSGTTGTPKGVWSGVLDERAAAAALAEERELWGFAADDVHLVVSPLYHSAPLRFAAGTLLAGGDVLVAGSFDLESLTATIAAARPTSTFVVPTHLRRLLASSDPPPLESFRLVAHAGAPCPARLKRAVIDAFPNGSVWEFYGSTEGQFTACAAEEWLARPGTVGRARPGRRLAIEESPARGEATEDQGGVIWCDVPEFARFEYWRDPVRTAAAWRGDAFSVGDLGRLDDDGYLFLDGRRDDLLITGGVNVYPLEVERVLLEHPEVRDAAVFGVADDDWGQRVCAAVVTDVVPDELSAWLRDRLAPHKRPKEIFPVDHVPVSATGKVRRSTLVADLGLGLDPIPAASPDSPGARDGAGSA